MTITQEVKDVLTQSEITATRVKLPATLDRSLYMKVDKVLKNAGGKWNSSVKSHVFQSDPREKLGMALETGISTGPITDKVIFQAFFTPKKLAERVVELADVAGKRVLEPSCGEGSLALECLKQMAAFITCVEINPDYAKVLEKKGLSVQPGDFLNYDFPDGKFDRIVMNPPFTKNQDVKHVAHALKFLGKNGKLVAIMANNTTRKCFVDLVAGLDYEIHSVEDGAFKESGTMVRTIILEINN